jgi:hypothetical protein
MGRIPASERTRERLKALMDGQSEEGDLRSALDVGYWMPLKPTRLMGPSALSNFVQDVRHPALRRPDTAASETRYCGRSPQSRPRECPA